MSNGGKLFTLKKKIALKSGSTYNFYFGSVSEKYHIALLKIAFFTDCSCTGFSQATFRGPAIVQTNCTELRATFFSHYSVQRVFNCICE